jgi:hypothetical protein
MRRENLVKEIERGALDGKVPLADTLRRCVALGGRAGSVELRTWASRELSGYGPDDELPEWRTVAAPLLVDFTNLRFDVRGKPIGPMDLPEFARDVVKEEVPLVQGVGELEAMLAGADDGSVNLGIPGGSDLVTFINRQNGNSYQTLHRIYWSVSTVTIQGVLHRIRNSLTELVAELHAGMPDDADVPSPDLARQAVQVAVHGTGHRVTLNTAQSGSGDVTQTAPSAPEEPARWKRWARIGGIVVGVATIVGTVAALAQWLG